MRLGGAVLIMMVVAVTSPSLLLVPRTAMKSPTLSAAELIIPDMLRNVVVDA
jgi:hypothetical protein